MLPTVAELLQLDVFRRGSPRVVAGADRLGAPVRWVHVLELADAAHLLQGGELVLTTGIALPDDATRLASELRLVLGKLIRRLRSEHRFSLSQGAVLGRLDREGTMSIGDMAVAERVRPQ